LCRIAKQWARRLHDFFVNSAGELLRIFALRITQGFAPLSRRLLRRRSSRRGSAEIAIR
jgi:hypothetical protein